MSSQKTSGKFVQKRIYASMKKDVVNPHDFLNYDIRSACEECSHFAVEKGQCTLGYNVGPHLKAQQLHDMELSSRMSQCRFHEID